MNEMIQHVSSRHLALALLIVALAGALLITIWPIWQINGNYDDRIRSAQLQLQKYNQVIAENEALRPDLERLRQNLLQEGRYLPGSTAATAGAELQRIIKRMAAAGKTQVISTQVLPSRQEADLMRIALKARIRGDYGALINVFHAIESSRVFLVMDSLSIRPAKQRRVLGVATSVQFDTDFEVTGYMPPVLHEN